MEELLGMVSKLLKQKHKGHFHLQIGQNPKG